jgi:DNA-directed RNA polymerase omega subunit
MQHMAEIPIEDLLPRANYSIYKLVSLASMRALELSDGKRCLVERPSSEKLTTMALEEIAQGKVMTKEASELLENKQDK